MPNLTGAPPRLLGDETEHYWLVQRMAQATGTDLVAAMEDGALSSADWAGMVTRCRGCTWTDGCGHWLDDPEAGGARPVPQDCENRARFAALAQRYPKEDAS